jgi:hypothetical protein
VKTQNPDQGLTDEGEGEQLVERREADDSTPVMKTKKGYKAVVEPHP